MPPMRQLTPLQLPSKRVIVAHTGDQTCSTLVFHRKYVSQLKKTTNSKNYFNFLQVSCTEHVQAIQRYHIESRRFDDIAYNFLVGGDGFVYVGRGWDFQGAHTKGFNANSICIAFIGTFDNYAPTEPQLYAAKKLIEEGVKLKKLPEDYALYGHRQLTPTQSPGTVLFNIIKTWEHWTEVVSRR